MAVEITTGDGYAIGSLDAMGEGYGFRKVRKELGVTAFGVNAIVMPPGYTSDAHFHDEQEELYICLEGTLTLTFDDGSHDLGPGEMARVDAHTVRSMGNNGDTDMTYICIGGKDGYVGRDGRRPGDEEE